MYWRSIKVVAVSLLLASCVATPLDTRDTETLAEIQQVLQEAQPVAQTAVVPPAAVSEALLPVLPSLSGSEVASAPRFDVFVDSVDAREFFMGLVKDTGYNMVVHPEVSGKISLELQAVTVDEVMAVVSEVYGYPYKKTGRLYRILPGGLQSELFQIDYLNLKRRGNSETQVSAGQVSNAGNTSTGVSNANNYSSSNNNSRNTRSNQGVIGTQIQTETEADFWKELTETLGVLIGNGDGRSVVVTPQAGVIVVRAFPNELDVVRDYLRRAELIMRRQVVLEAKILEVRLSDGYQTGIDWTGLGTPGSDNTIAFGVSGTPPVSASGVGGIFGIGLDLGDFSGVLAFLETQGSVQVLSSPRISTINNQKAVIKVGQDEFFVTDVANTTTTSTGTTSNNPEIELTPFFSGIALDVTPQISEDEEIILHIHPSISEVNDQTKIITLGDISVELPLALSTIRETDSVVFARSGQVVILGGLMQNIASDENSGAPGFADVPFLGHLFTQQRNATVKSELVILLRPVIMGPNGLPSALDRSIQRYQNFDNAMGERRFYSE
jgi:MSHA biogenesis protein MshL